MTRKIVLLCFILLGLYFQNYSAIFTEVRALEVTPDTIVELNDVVKLNYTLWIEAGDPVEQQNGTVWVHDPDDPNAPSELYEQFPDLFVPPNLGFMENILGMKANTFKTFDISFSSGKAFNNATDPFYNYDLSYLVYLEDILLDVTVLPLTLFDIPFFRPLFFFVVSLTFVIIYFRIKRFNKSHNILGSKMICHSCGNPATVKCGNPSCHTIYCKDCFINNVHCAVCSSNKMMPLT